MSMVGINAFNISCYTSHHEKPHTCFQQLFSVLLVDVGELLPVIPASGLPEWDAKSLAYLLYPWAVFASFFFPHLQPQLVGAATIF